MHEMQTVVIGVCGVCPPVLHSEAKLGFTVQKRLGMDQDAVWVNTLGARGTLCYTGVLIHFQILGPLISQEWLKLES